MYVTLDPECAQATVSPWEPELTHVTREAAERSTTVCYTHYVRYTATGLCPDCLSALDAYQLAEALGYACPDCGGLGMGCCVNADIPLPGVER